MSSAPHHTLSAGRLHSAIVLGADEDTCRVVAAGGRSTVPFAEFFPRPRAERVAPGHLVAVTAMGEAVVWRWFDAVVLDQRDATVTLWEPGHGSVVAAARDPQRRYRTGSRAYLSAGLPGAEWWVAGPVVDEAGDADVDLDEVEEFLARLGAW